MKRPYGYNSPKGVANNAAQKQVREQVRGKVLPINQEAIQQGAETVIPTAIKSTEHRKKS